MDVAGVVIGSIALLLSLFGVAAAGFQVQRYYRFRRPQFKPVDASFEANVRDSSRVTIGPGKVTFLVRGASRPILLTQYEIYSSQPDPNSGRFGVSSTEELNVELMPEGYRKLNFEAILGYPVVGQTTPPRKFTFEVFIKSPEEVFVVSVPLMLTQGADRYVLDTYKDWWRFANRTYFRQKYGLRDRIRRLKGP